MSETEIHGLERTTLSLVLPLYGGTMRGPLNLFRETPINPLEAASKAYVDKKTAEGGSGASPWVDLEITSSVFEQRAPLQSRTIAGGYLCEVRGELLFQNFVDSRDFPLHLANIVPIEMRPTLWLYQPVFLVQENISDVKGAIPLLWSLVISPNGEILMRSYYGIGTPSTIQDNSTLVISSCYGTAL